MLQLAARGVDRRRCRESCEVGQLQQALLQRAPGRSGGLHCCIVTAAGSKMLLRHGGVTSQAARRAAPALALLAAAAAAAELLQEAVHAAVGTPHHRQRLGEAAR